MGNDADGRVLYLFPRVGEELAAATAARRLAGSDEKAPGEVVFASDDEPPEHSRLN